MSEANPSRDSDGAVAFHLTQPGRNGFEEFWKAYPAARRVKKERALAAWRKLNPDAGLMQKMFTALGQQARSRQWDDPRFIPHPASWLNARRWEDPVEGFADPECCPECGHYRRHHMAGGCAVPGCACRL